jgi:hypothetical protein
MRSTRSTFDRRYPAVTCTRCGEDRWPRLRLETPFICQRCREVLAGRTAVVDSLPSLARQAAGRRLNEAFPAGSNRPGVDLTAGRTRHRPLTHIPQRPAR